ncbi:MAG: thiamine pyrophosphate-binding protein [Caulobacteraceae bacterium]
MPDSSSHPIRNGGQILVEALAAQGTDRSFGVPGESYLAVLDALYDSSIEFVICRHEGAAANAAEADGKLTGRPGICFVTRGPGATHASCGVHTAMQDSTPMVLFIGQVDQPFREREAFQEIDYRAFFGPIAKWATEIESADRIPEIVARAFAVAMSGRPGPVVIALPEDVLTAMSDAAVLPRSEPARSGVRSEDMAVLREELVRAKRPLVLLGGSGWTEAACADIRAFAEANGLPVAVSFRRQDLLDNNDQNYVGLVGLGTDPALDRRVREADLLLAVGARLSENATAGYQRIKAPQPDQRLIHVHPSADEIGKVFRPVLGIAASMPEFAAAARGMAPGNGAGWADWLKDARADFEAWTDAAKVTPPPEGVNLAACMAHLNETLPDTTIMANGAGNYAIWLHRFWRYRRFRTQVAPTSGAMGYGLPGAVAAKLRCPDAPVIAVLGDGEFQMYPQELGTAVQSGANIIVLVVNNGIYGTIRMHQEKTYPGRVSGTTLKNPDFAGLAESFGCHAEKVDRTSDFAAAFDRAMQAVKPALIELVTDPAQITPSLRI